MEQQILRVITMHDRPNVLFILADQLRASSLPAYGESQIETPNLDKLAADGVTFTNTISSCPVCTPYRSMLLTGRHPQSTGHLINFMITRHDEIGIGDAFARAGYRTGWVGKWHLHTGSFPQINGPDYVPEGRDRLGFQYWRGYNFHTDYFDGTVNRDDWRYEHWEGYETDALARYAMEFMDEVGDEPFCVFVSPHQPHVTGGAFAPDKYYERLPEVLALPENVSEELRDTSLEAYRDYLAMTLTLDDMVGELLDYLDEKGLRENTLVVFTSDHGTQMGAQGWWPWNKKLPYEESLLVPMFVRLPGVFKAGTTCDALTAPVDFFPTLCGLCGVPAPRSIEGHDLSDAWQGKPGAFEQDAVFTMNFTKDYNHLQEGEEWRGVRTKTAAYAEWLSGLTELYDLVNDPLEQTNLAGRDDAASLQAEMAARLAALMAKRGDRLEPCTTCADWYDDQRRVVRNAHGPLPDPEAEPDWSLLA
jgi:arylsulfatase A-like enzyme